MAHIYVDIFAASRAFCLIQADLKLYQTLKVTSFRKSGNSNAESFSTYFLKNYFFYCTLLVPQASLLICGDRCCVAEVSHIKHLKGVIFCKLKGQSWMRPLFSCCGQRQRERDGWEIANFPVLPQACMKSDLECVCWNNSYGRVNSTNTTCWLLWEIG